MALEPGSRIGPYEVTAKLGEGGMGEVYRATDTKLKREVAIKVLPDEVGADHERLARFQREAEVLASLNHPNIAHVYGLEVGDGQTDAGAGRPSVRPYIVMELVEGEDLAARISRGAIPLDEALPMARQIAVAIEAAHEAGVIHRDLKPANIKIRDDGTVKVLDFGLAKALDRSLTGTSAQSIANSPTITSAGVTVRGVILGTAAYMSPEQARGKAVDKRTDIWAFGVVLYEMLTARRPFHGETVSDSVAAILKSDPDWRALPEDTPFLIKRLLRHCLNRDPRERLGDIRDARIEIDEAVSVGPDIVPRAGSSRRAWLPWAVAGVSLTVTLALAVSRVFDGSAGEQDSTAEPIRFAFLPPEDARPSYRPVISPDGRHVAFLAAGRSGYVSVWLHSLGSGITRELPGTGRAEPPGSLFWSPDSRSIGFFAEGKLKRASLDQEAPFVVCEARDGRGGSWNAAGDIVFSLIAGPLLKVSAAGGTPVTLAPLGEGARSHRFPSFLPDGDHFVFAALVGSGTRLLLGSLSNNETRELRSIDTLAGTAAPDLVLYSIAGRLVAQRIDLSAAALTGEPRPIADAGWTNALHAWASASLDHLVYRRAPSIARLVLVWVDRKGTISRLPLPPGNYGDPSLSPDGRRLALSIRDESGQHIWLYDLERQTLTKRTFDGEFTFPIWSRDGRFVTATRGPNLVGDLVRFPSDGSGGIEVLVQGKGTDQIVATSWSADERVLAFQLGTDVHVREADGSTRLLLSGTGVQREARFSPDGRWLAYRSNEAGRDDVYIQSYPPGKGKWQLSTDGGAQPMWSANGRELFFKSGNKLMSVAVDADTAIEPGAPRLLVEMPLPERVPGDPARFAVSPDGSRFLLTTNEGTFRTDAAEAPVHVILNWRRLTRD